MEGISNKDISIYTDNQAAITAIGSNTIRSFTVKKLQRVFEETCKAEPLCKTVLDSWS